MTETATNYAVRSSDLRSALSAVLAVAKLSDKALPVLRRVHGRLEGGTLTLTATDRYSLHVVEVPLVDPMDADMPAREATFDFDAIKFLLAGLPRRADHAPVTLTSEFAFDLAANWNGERAVRGAPKGSPEVSDYPRVTHILGQAVEAPGHLSGGIALSPTTLAPLAEIAKAQKVHVALRFTGHNKALVATWENGGNKHAHLIMPVRSGSVDEWTVSLEKGQSSAA